MEITSNPLPTCRKSEIIGGRPRFRSRGKTKKRRPNLPAAGSRKKSLSRELTDHLLPPPPACSAARNASSAKSTKPCMLHSPCTSPSLSETPPEEEKKFESSAKAQAHRCCLSCQAWGGGRSCCGRVRLSGEKKTLFFLNEAAALKESPPVGNGKVSHLNFFARKCPFFFFYIQRSD